MGMTIEEAIKHCEEVAEEQRELFRLCPIPSEMCDPNKDCASLKNGKNRGCLKCGEEHEQIAEWLKDYKKLLGAIEDIKGEVELRLCDVVSDYTDGYRTAIRGVLQIIDEHTSGEKRTNDKREVK